MKKVLIITANYNCDYGVRIKFLESFLAGKGYECSIATGNFDHRKKVKYKIDRPSVVQLDVPAYQKNLSVQRIFSHFVFAKKVLNFCNEQQPDLIYAITPPNFIFRYLKKYKQKHNVRLIYEIMDLWPESLPYSEAKKKRLKPFTDIWAGIRNRNINSADFLVYECDLYRTYLQGSTRVPGKTVYLTKAKAPFENKATVFDGVLRYVYLGSINNIIDIDMITDILELSAGQIPTELHIIGGGENTEALLKSCADKQIPVINHGVIYDDDQKAAIFSQCHLALNIMKSMVFVGATMKSLEYFHYGMPVINNIKGDTAEMIETGGCGLNVLNRQRLESDLTAFIAELSGERLQEMSENANKLYERHFSPEVFKEEIAEVIG